MPEQTMQEAARELHSAVIALKELIERDYPDRSEVESRFMSKGQGKRRWYVVLVLILVSMFLSFVTTTATISTCFLGGGGKDGLSHPGICRILPGYEDTIHQNKQLLKVFSHLMHVTSTNTKRINKLEGR